MSKATYTASNLSWVQQKRGGVIAAVTTFLIPSGNETKGRKCAGLKPLIPSLSILFSFSRL